MGFLAIRDHISIIRAEVLISRKSDKVIITCAVTGSVHTPTMSPYLPITPEKIAADALAAAAEGAAILHLHARDAKDGRPTPDPNVFMKFLPSIAAQTDAVINITTGGGAHMSLDERLAAPLRIRPELCSLNMGSMNFGMFGMVEKYATWQNEWERGFLQATRNWVFKNTFSDIEHILKVLGEECGTRFEFECYDTSHLYTLAYYLEKGLVQPPLFVQSIFGIFGGTGPDAENVTMMKTIADRLFGDSYVWSVLGAGRHQMALITIGALLGGNVRVGLEDSLYRARGELARSNAEQVKQIRTVLEALSFKIASPADAREMLGLKGAQAIAL